MLAEKNQTLYISNSACSYSLKKPNNKTKTLKLKNLWMC